MIFYFANFIFLSISTFLNSESCKNTIQKDKSIINTVRIFRLAKFFNFIRKIIVFSRLVQYYTKFKINENFLIRRPQKIYQILNNY